MIRRCLPVRLMNKERSVPGGWFGTSLDEASVKPRWKTHWEGLLIHGLKLNFHRYIGQLRRLSPPHRKTPWRRLFVHKWHACEDDDYVHAKRNDKAVLQNNRRPKTRKASRSFVSLQESNKRRPHGCLVYDLCKWSSSRPIRGRIKCYRVPKKLG